MEMTKREVKKALGIDTDAELARLFGVGRWAVGQWPDDKPIPEGRQWQLRALRPDKFPVEEGALAHTPAAADGNAENPALKDAA